MSGSTNAQARESSYAVNYTCPSEKPLNTVEQNKLVQLRKSLEEMVPHGVLPFLSAWQQHGIEINVVWENHIAVAEHSIARLGKDYEVGHFDTEVKLLSNRYGTKIEVLPTVPAQSKEYKEKVRTLILRVFSSRSR